MIGASNSYRVREAEARAALADAMEADLPVCACCRDRLYPGDRLSRIEINREEVVLCRFCLSNAFNALEVLE